MLSHLQSYNIFLASKSPRRQALLKGLDIEFAIRTKETDEEFPEHLKADEIVLYLSKKKADAFSGELQEKDILITADTIVWINNRVLNKPENKTEAIEMLKLLSGKKHTVYTGVCITASSFQTQFVGSTQVWFKELTLAEIDYYLDHYKPYDKAGSYGVQEWIGYIGIDRIEGCFYNVMGLPLNLLYAHLREIPLH